MNKIKKWFIALILLCFVCVIIDTMVVPRSFKNQQQAALDEFKSYIDERNMDKKYFHGPYLNFQNEEYREFCWKLISQKGDSGVLHIKVPYYSFKEIESSYMGSNKAWDAVFNTDPDN